MAGKPETRELAHEANASFGAYAEVVETPAYRSAGALCVWVPRDRPGIPRPKSSVNWARLRHLAGPARPQVHPIQAPH